MATEQSENDSTVGQVPEVVAYSNPMERTEIKASETFDKAEVPDTGGGECSSDITEMDNSDESTVEGGECSRKAELEEDSSKLNQELVAFKIVFNKQKYDVSFPLDENIASLKKHVETLTGVPPTMQKVMFKGLCKDDKTLREIGFANGVKVMVVGSTLHDILAVNTPSTEEFKDDKAVAAQKEPLCQQKMHRKVLDKGLPEDVQPGIRNVKESLPPFPISGMMNKSGGKVRLTFKLELDQVWIGTKERTDKIPMNSIKNIISEPIEGHEEHHIMGIQLGTTEASRYWLYWVPAQFIDAIKDAILGKWQYF